MQNEPGQELHTAADGVRIISSIVQGIYMMCTYITYHNMVFIKEL